MFSPGNINLLNALTLMAMSYLGFTDSGDKTALIPLIFGVVLLVMTNAIRDHNKVVAHIAVVLTLVVLMLLVGMRLPKSIAIGDTGIYRIIAMIFTSFLAMVAFIKSFIDAKKERERRLD